MNKQAGEQKPTNKQKQEGKQAKQASRQKTNQQTLKPADLTQTMKRERKSILIIEQHKVSKKRNTKTDKEPGNKQSD